MICLAFAQISYRDRFRSIHSANRLAVQFSSGDELSSQVATHRFSVSAQQRINLKLDILRQAHSVDLLIVLSSLSRSHSYFSSQLRIRLRTNDANKAIIILQTKLLSSSLSSSSYFILCCLPAPDVDQTDKHSAASSASSENIASKLPQCAETDITVIYRHLEGIIDIGDMKRLANYLLAGAFRTNEGSKKVMDAMPAGREATAALFLECLLEIVNKHNPSAPIGEMIYKAMMKFIPDTAEDCKSVLFEADKKSRSQATHHEDDDKDDEDATPLANIPSKLPRYKHDVLLLLQAANEHAQLHSKQQQKSNVVIQRLLSHGLNLRGVHLSHSQCQAVGNVLQTHGQHCGPVVDLTNCQLGNVGLQLLANGLQQCENTTRLDLEYNDITDCTVVRCVIEKLRSKLELLWLFETTRFVTVVRGVWRTSYASASIWKSSNSATPMWGQMLYQSWLTCYSPVES